MNPPVLMTNLKTGCVHRAWEDASGRFFTRCGSTGLVKVDHRLRGRRELSYSSPEFQVRREEFGVTCKICLKQMFLPGKRKR